MESLAIKQYFEERLESIVELIRQLVDIESPSHDRVRSGEVAELIKSKFSELGTGIVVESASVDDGEHLIIRAFPGSESPVLFLGHTDTVHPVGSNAVNPTRVEGDLFYGCGIFDMKANIAIALAALEYFVKTGQRPSRPITIVLSCDEEIGSHMGRAIVEREAAKAAYCLVLEPSADGRVKTGRKGTGVYTLCTKGMPAHAGLEPEKGANAISELALQVPQIHALGNRDLGTTVNVTTVKGGTTSNVIPEFAQCDIDVRFKSSLEAERVDTGFRSLKPFDDRVTIEIIGGINRPPLERTPEVLALFEKARDLASSFGYVLEETQVGGASDGNFVAALGVPVIDGLGIRGAGAHMATEHIQVSDIASRATLITLLLRDL